MKILEADFRIETPREEVDRTYTMLEKIGRVCYKSEDRITEDSAQKFILMLQTRGHEAMLEHRSISVRFITDRGVTHEIVRHRIASYAQESTRYCNYSKDKFGRNISVIDVGPAMRLEVGKVVNSGNGITHTITMDDVCGWLTIWLEAMRNAEEHYMNLTQAYCPAQLARSVLPNSLKTEIIVTMNIREWFHFFTLRTPVTAHPQMREITMPLLQWFQTVLPTPFNMLKLDWGILNMKGEPG